MDRKENAMTNLKTVLFSALYSWKLIVILALVCGILLGAAQAMKVGEENTPTQTQTQLTSVQENELLEAEYWAERAWQNYERQKEYMDSSVVMQMDYLQVHKASVTYFVDTDYQIQPGSTYQDVDYTQTLVKVYEKYAKDPEQQGKIAEEMGISIRFLQELISVTAEESTITIDVRHFDQEAAEQILSLVQQNLATAPEMLNETVCTHQLTKLLESSGLCVDATVLEEQRISNEKLVDYRNKAVQNQQVLDELEARYGMLTSGVVNAKDGKVKTFVKWAVLGGIIGVLVAALLVIMRMVFSDKITSEKKLTNRVALELLGTLAQEKKRDKITAWLRKLEGRQMENSEEHTRYLAENLLNHVGESKKILICSDTENREAELVTKFLQKHVPNVTLIAAGNLSWDAEALKQLREADALVLAITMGDSSAKGIAASVKQIRQMNKPIAGIVVVD